MPRARARSLGLAALVCLALPQAAAAAGSGEQAYEAHCAECHGAERLGGMGPALLPGNLKRLKPAKAKAVIADGRAATQMPAFGDRLSPQEVEDLVALIYSPPAEEPVWGEAEIVASREVIQTPETLPNHHVTVLDGDSFSPLTRFPSRFALHGGPKFSPEGRFVYFASRDGWITKYDLYGLAVVAEVRAGINTRNLAISHDGRVLAVANYLPHSLVLLDAGDLTPLKVIEAADLRGETTSRVSAVYQAAPRESFVVALKDVPRRAWRKAWPKPAPFRSAGCR
jgi:mono/diheme cytochrome c family protein